MASASMGLGATLPWQDAPPYRHFRRASTRDPMDEIIARTQRIKVTLQYMPACGYFIAVIPVAIEFELVCTRTRKRGDDGEHRWRVDAVYCKEPLVFEKGGAPWRHAGAAHVAKLLHAKAAEQLGTVSSFSPALVNAAGLWA